MLLVGGTEEVLALIRHTSSLLIVDDLVQTKVLLEQAGPVITHPFTHTHNGTMLYIRHPDGNVVKYVQWLPELVKRIID